VRSETVTTVLPAPPERVFDYMSDVRNLPRWATEFARELRREGDRWIVRNNLGELVFEIRADESTGVIDMLAGPCPDELAVFPTRVVGLPGGGSAYSFTMFQAPGMPDELFESQHASLRREFAHIRRRFGAR
jgi:Polyketide cyclase / dehydrase and lipid transport